MRNAHPQPTHGHRNSVITRTTVFHLNEDGGFVTTEIESDNELGAVLERPARGRLVALTGDRKEATLGGLRSLSAAITGAKHSGEMPVNVLRLEDGQWQVHSAAVAGQSLRTVLRAERHGARLVALPADENRWGNGDSADRWRLAQQHAAEQAAAMTTMTETGNAEVPRISEPLPTAAPPR